MSLVSAGVGISLIPQIALNQAPQSVAVVPLEPPRPARHIGVATRQHRARAQPYVDALIDALRRGIETGRCVRPELQRRPRAHRQ
jgi:DNA-binding transcriptional LysR family regulator